MPTSRSAETVSFTMSRIRSKDTSPEVRLRKALWARGLRYRKHYSKLPGKPDIAFPRQHVVVFCDGIFWHGRDWEARKARLLTPNREYWIKKIERNMARDARVNAELEAEGWQIIRFWEDEITGDLEACVDKVASLVKRGSDQERGVKHHPLRD